MDKNAKDIFQYALGGLLITGFFVLLGLLIYVTIPTANEKALDIVIGALVGAVSTVIGYFFGSSKGSSEKDAIIAASAPIDQK